METYRIDMIDGHITINIDGRTFLVDTGAPVSFGKGGPFQFLGKEIPCPEEWLTLDIGSISQFIDGGIQAILGGDVLANTYSLIDLRSKEITFSTVPQVIRGFDLPAQLFMDVPLVNIKVDGVDHPVFYDTGARISFLAPELLEGRESIGIHKDFYPLYGTFETDLYSVSADIGGLRVHLIVGALPEMLEDLLNQADAKGILGNDILEYFPVYLALPEGKILVKVDPRLETWWQPLKAGKKALFESLANTHDRVFIKRLLERESNAEEEFVKRFGDIVFTVLRSDFDFSEDLVQDLFQDVFVHLWENGQRRIRMWQGTGKFAAYLRVLVRNLVKDYLRKQLRVPQGRVSDPDDPASTLAEIPDNQPGPDELVELTKLRTSFKEILDQLPERDCEILTLWLIEEKSYREISEIMGITVSNVGVSKKRALKRFMIMLKLKHPDLFPEVWKDEEDLL